MTDIQTLQHLLLVGDAKVHVRGREIGEASGIGHIHLEDLRHFVRNTIHQLSQRFGGGDRTRHQLVELHRVGRRFLGSLNLRDGERIDLIDGVDRDAAKTLERDLHRVAGQIDALVHAGGHPNASDEIVRVDRIIPISRRHDQRHDEARLLVRPKQRKVLGGAHLHRDRSQWVHDRGAQRHQGQRGRQLGAKNFFLALAARHGDAGEPRIRS